MTPIFISNNCVSGFIDWVLQREHLHPWVFCFLCPEDAINFYKNIDSIEYNNFTIHPYTDWKYYRVNPSLKWTLTKETPIEKSIVLRYANGIEVLYPHYNIDHIETFIEKYNRRLNRFLNVKDRHITYCFQTYPNESDEFYKDFLDLKGDKILFDNKHIAHLINEIPDLIYFTCNSIHNVLGSNTNTRQTWGILKEYIINKYEKNSYCNTI